MVALMLIVCVYNNMYFNADFIVSCNSTPY